MNFRTSITTCLVATLLAGAGMTPAFGQEDTRQFSAQSGEQVNQALQLANEDKFEDALVILRRAISDTDLSPYERSTIYQMTGQYSYELNRLAEAQRAFASAVSAGGLLPKEAGNIKTVIAQLMIGNGQYRDGAEALEAHLKSGGEHKPQFVELLVNAWVQAEDYQRALPWATKWFETAEPKMRRHYDLMNFLYNNLGMPERQADIVKEMIDKWPEDITLWDSLVSVLAYSDREREAFEVIRLMYQSGLLKTEDEILKLVKYHDFYDMPFQGAEILESEIREGRVSKTADNQIFLASLFRQARVPDRAVPIMENVAKLTDDLEIYVDLGKTLSRIGECEKAETHFRTAMEQGYAENKAQNFIGNCYADNVSKADRLTCSMSDSEVASAPITLARYAAIETFAAVHATSDYFADAQNWVSVFSAEMEAFERRCGHHWHGHERELCYHKIKQAYDAVTFTSDFKLEDKSCEKYIPEYDAKYRRAEESE